MARATNQLDVCFEIGKKRTFAGVIEWPGWSRSGRDEESALQALLDYGPRYERALHGFRLGFHAPSDVSVFNVIERLKGDATTDFGTPGIAPSSDLRTVSDADLKRFKTLLQACWQTFDTAVKAATGKELRKGPRGGGREADGIIGHVLGGEGSYLSMLGWKLQLNEKEDFDQQLAQARQTILQALDSAPRTGTPEPGPRGGKRWTSRYFVRREAWHVLDHAWEIEDRIL